MHNIIDDDRLTDPISNNADATPFMLGNYRSEQQCESLKRRVKHGKSWICSKRRSANGLMLWVLSPDSFILLYKSKMCTHLNIFNCAQFLISTKGINLSSSYKETKIGMQKHGLFMFPWEECRSWPEDTGEMLSDIMFHGYSAIKNKSPTSLFGYNGVSKSEGGRYEARFSTYRVGSYVLKADAALAYDAFWDPVDRRNILLRYTSRQNKTTLMHGNTNWKLGEGTLLMWTRHWII